MSENSFTTVELIENVLKLYKCQAEETLLSSIYSDDPEFEDPISHAKGRKEVWSQWYSMPKIFSNSVTEGYTIVSDEPDKLVFNLSQTYTFRWGGKKKTMPSKVVLDLDANGKVVRHQDLWNGKKLSWWLHLIRLVNAKLVRLFIYGFR